ncbi:chemotaxis protein CheW [Oscillospiraceae bacterium MB08-C2-2]|nr:chemotaxis protein CheW [Oscillospiraceae bacterium MB08-C2-2]
MSKQELWQIEYNDENTTDNRYLTFRADNQLFGISIREVVQIVGMQEITQLPDHPSYIKGVISLREDIIPVIDVRVRFGRPQGAYDDRTCIIITKLPEGSYGFIVDEVDEVCDLLPEQIILPPQVKSEISNCRYLKGIAHLSKGLDKREKTILIIVASELLEEHELVELSRVTEN